MKFPSVDEISKAADAYAAELIKDTVVNPMPHLDALLACAFRAGITYAFRNLQILDSSSDINDMKEEVANARS